MATAARGGRTSSFSRSPSSFSPSPSSPLHHHPGIKLGPNAAAFVSSGIPDLDSNFSFLLLSFFLLNSGPSFHFDSVLCLFRDFGRWVSLGEHSDGDGGCRCPSPPPFVEEFHVAGNRASPVTAVCEPLKGAQSFSWHASFSHVGLITVFVFFVQGWETRCNFLNFFNWLDFLWIWMHDLFMILWIGWFAGEGFEDCMAVQEVFWGPARCWDSE